MNLDNERKAFDKHIEDTHGHTVEQNNKLPVAALDLMMWNMWLASANREGYKLVPVEPKFETMQEMNVAIIENISETPKYRMQQVYKAMIGACDDH